MTDIDLDKLEALAKAATQGEWVTRYPSHTVVMAMTPDGTYQGEVARTVSGSLNAQREANAAFIAAANPATILDLIASARRDAEEIERLRARLAKWEPATFAGPAGSTFEPFAQPYSHQQTSDASKIWRETSSAARAAHTGEG